MVHFGVLRCSGERVPFPTPLPCGRLLGVFVGPSILRVPLLREAILVKLFRELDEVSQEYRHCALTIGNFDGVHRGHAEIVRRLMERAAELSTAAVVFTFDPHPATILRPDRAPPPLTWTERKLDLLCRLGVDAVIAYPVDRAFLRMEARQFFDSVVRRRLDARALVEGRNFFFGHNRAGNVDVLESYCRECGLPLDVVEPLAIDGRVVSSSRVRESVAAGDVEEARRMLGGPYRIRGVVAHGAGRGAEIGYPTANLEEVDTLLPAEGIYAGRAVTEERTWPAAVSVGPNPTFDEGALKVEAYLLDFSGSLYGRRIEVDFLSRLRKIERFDSVGQLVAQMDRDVASTREIALQYNA